MLDENPYQPGLLDGSVDAKTRIKTALWWIIYLHPAIALTLTYACWLLTTASLGRPPRFGEHPDNDFAHRMVHVLDFPAMLLILGTPFLIPIAVIWGWAQPFGASRPPKSSIHMRIVCLTLYILMLAIVWSICFFDPFRVLYWFFD